MIDTPVIKSEEARPLSSSRYERATTPSMSSDIYQARHSYLQIQYTQLLYASEPYATLLWNFDDMFTSRIYCRLHIAINCTASPGAVDIFQLHLMLLKSWLFKPRWASWVVDVDLFNLLAYLVCCECLCGRPYIEWMEYTCKHAVFFLTKAYLSLWR